MIKISRQKVGIHLLRLSLAGVFLYFGFSQLIDSLSWVGLVPEWAVNLSHLPPAMIVIFNGIFEVILGSLLAMGFLVRFSAFILGLHLFVIALDFGFVATGIRDFGLVAGSFALALIYVKEERPEQIKESNSVGV